jgi:hypothetical protein
VIFFRSLVHCFGVGLSRIYISELCVKYEGYCIDRLFVLCMAEGLVRCLWPRATAVAVLYGLSHNFSGKFLVFLGSLLCFLCSVFDLYRIMLFWVFVVGP